MCEMFEPCDVVERLNISIALFPVLSVFSQIHMVSVVKNTS